MDYATAKTVKLCVMVLGLTPLYAQQPDSADILVQARDQVLGTAGHLPAFSCTLTAERTYYSRVSAPDPAPPCDQISVDRKKARYKLRVDATDRIRLKVFIRDGREVFAWVDPLKYESHDLEEVIARGPIGTGALGAYFMELFGNPYAHFQFLGEKDGKLEYGFQEPGGGIVKAGSFIIDSRSLDPERLTVETSALPRETSICMSTSNVDYRRVQIGSEKVLLPRQAESHDVMANTHETRSVITYSACTAELPSLDPPLKAASVLPENHHVILALDDAIDFATAAAGDVVTATVAGNGTLLHEGTRVRGRILSIGSYPILAQPSNGGPSRLSLDHYFGIAISFDVVEIDGASSPFHVRFNRAAARVAGKPILAEGNRWPEDSLLFKTTDANYVIPRGFRSEWISTR